MIRQILDFLRSVTSSQDLMDTELYVQRLGGRIAETDTTKVKAQCKIIKEEDGNQLTLNLTEIGRLDCGHWNIELSAQCCICHATFCKYCVSENIGHNCQGCGRYCCPTCASVSILDPKIAVCSQCGPSSMLPSIIRKYLCDS